VAIPVLGELATHPPGVFLRKNVILGELCCANAQECDSKPFRPMLRRFMLIFRVLEGTERERRSEVTWHSSTACLLCQYE
jgi:hypothetical protein